MLKLFYLLGFLGWSASAVDLPQHVIGKDTCDEAGQTDNLYTGECICGSECCNSSPVEEGCPVDVVVAIDMCSCSEDTMDKMKDFTQEVLDALHNEFGVSDTTNSARMHVMQFMDENTVEDVVSFDTFTRKELEKAIRDMTLEQFKGRGTNLKTAIDKASKILANSDRAGEEGRKSAFVLITNGYSDDSKVSDAEVFQAALQMSEQGGANLRMIFVARGDASNGQTNDEIAKAFSQVESLKDPIAAQQVVGDLQCDDPPEPNYQRECKCNCDVPMGCHGIQGSAGDNGQPGPRGECGPKGEHGIDGAKGPDGDGGPEGDKGGCGMPGQAGEKGDPGDDGLDGEDGTEGAEGIQGAPGMPGDAGDKGPKGEPGTKGPAGQQGTTGEPGDAGDQGDQGPDGELNETTLKWLVNKIFIEELNAMGIQSPNT